MALARRTLFSLPILGAGLAAPGLLRAQGAGWCGQFQELRLGISSAENERDAVARQEPFAAQVLPAFLSQALYTLESNARSASILGVVGAGGIGLALSERIRINNWDEVAFILLMILLTVAVVDFLSRRLRMALLRA